MKKKLMGATVVLLAVLCGVTISTRTADAAGRNKKYCGMTNGCPPPDGSGCKDSPGGTFSGKTAPREHRACVAGTGLLDNCTDYYTDVCGYYQQWTATGCESGAGTRTGPDIPTDGPACSPLFH